MVQSLTDHERTKTSTVKQVIVKADYFQYLIPADITKWQKYMAKHRSNGEVVSSTNNTTLRMFSLKTEVKSICNLVGILSYKFPYQRTYLLAEIYSLSICIRLSILELLQKNEISNV